jgi:arylsulfatase A-like enzyme
VTPELLPTPDRSAAETLRRGTLVLALTLVAVKAYYIGLPGAGPTSLAAYARALAATSSLDVLFTLALWLTASTALLATTAAPARPRLTRAVVRIFLAIGACAALYAVASVVMFGIFGGFLTYRLLALVGDVRMLRSSVAMHLSPGVGAMLVALPTAYVLAVVALGRLRRPVGAVRWRRDLISAGALGVWVLAGQYAYTSEWTTRQDRRIAENAHWVLASSVWRAATTNDTVSLSADFGAADLGDFAPPDPSHAVRRALFVPKTGRAARSRTPQRAPNVILVVLESVAARWTGLGNGRYDTTPRLAAEAAHGLVFDRFYAHVGRSSNSLASILLSTYPKLDFKDLTEEYPQLEGTSLASHFREHGYRTSFVTSSDLRWAGWSSFIGARGFDRVRDYRDLACDNLLSSWGVEDRCLVDDLIGLVKQDRAKPFFMMAWSQQTHHPYEPSPGRPMLDLMREPVHDEYELGRYLNVLRETDDHLGQLFDAVRAAGIANDTLIVVTGDHGQAFGYPHNTYIQGRTIYEEDVNVPLMMWFPRAYRRPARPAAIGGHVDLAPTIAEIAGLPVAPDWQGRSLLDQTRPPRAYFYVAEDHFRLGVRDGDWKYIYDLREGSEELYRLDLDPTEQRNLAATDPARCARLRQRLAAWAEANRRQYVRADGKT